MVQDTGHVNPAWEVRVVRLLSEGGHTPEDLCVLPIMGLGFRV